MAEISRRERWLVAVGVAAAVIAVGYLYGIEPALERRRQTAELVPARQTTLQRRRDLVTSRPTLIAELERAKQQLDEQSKRLLSGPTPPLAASELQRLVKDLAVSAGVEVRSERVLSPADRDGIQEIPIEITVAGGIRECVGLLERLERTGKLLTVQDVRMRVISTGQPRDLLTTLTVAGYLLPGAAGSRPADRPQAGARPRPPGA
jgi:Tfp pilus assembly protein PilO